ncbi:class I SAM-dependent methyltransferase [Candidatus Pelagibacter sp.]|nr:class I SAM-dependent methyltransferase [Candidatus Pelagibacter sp.]
MKIKIRSNLLKKVIKTFLIDPISGIFVSILKLLKIIDFPVPPNSSMRKTTASGNIFTYYNSGSSYLPIATMAEKYGLNLREKNLNILDFGCGVGRLLLHFTRVYKSNKYFACDVDDTSISFLLKNYPNVDSHTNNYSPPIKYEDSKFDMIYALSIFSHLDISDQALWLKELSRITKSGGYLFLTIEGYHALNIWLYKDLGLNKDEAFKKLEKEGYIFASYNNWEETVQESNILKNASQLRGVKKPYGMMVIDKSFIKKNWNKYNLEVVDIIEGIITTRQDLVVLRKK